jgi:hypothetical protein
LRIFAGILAFELRFYGKRLSTWIYAALFGGLGFLVTQLAGGAIAGSNFAVGGTDGSVKVNSPYITTILVTVLSLFATMVTAAIAGTSGQRDHADGMHALVFSCPVGKWPYLLGRTVGAAIVSLGVCGAIGVGLWLGSLSPLVDAERFGPTHLVDFFVPYATVVGPNVIFTTGLLVALAASTRRMLPNYLAGVVLVVGWMLAGNIDVDPQNRTLAALLDPFGMQAIDDLTRYWTSAEKNLRTVPFQGLLVVNRALWIGLSVLAFAVFGRRFRRSPRVERARAVAADETPTTAGSGFPRTERVFDRLLVLQQVWRLFRRSLRDTVANVYFAAIVGAGLLFLIVSARQVGRVFGTPTWPVTQLVVEVLGGTFSLFVLILVTLFAGEMVFRDRDLGLDQIVDTMPVPDWAPVVARLASLVTTVALLMGVVLLAGVSTQLVLGYTRFELGLYVKSLFGVSLVHWVLLGVLALFAHVALDRKIAAHVVMVLFYGFTAFRMGMGIEHKLWVYGSSAGMEYSDMNGYGPFLVPWIWFTSYWVAWAVLLGIATTLLAVRGREPSFRRRLARARTRFGPGLRALAIVAAVAVLSLGAFIFVNTNVVNRYRTTDDVEQRQADWERHYARLEHAVEPRVVATRARIDLYPRTGQARASGTLRLRNESAHPIAVAHIRTPWDVRVRRLVLAAGADGPARRPRRSDVALAMYTFALDPPLAPGAEATLFFETSLEAPGFENHVTRTAVVGNGTLLHNVALLPAVGYTRERELGQDRARKEHGLPTKPRMPRLEDPAARANNYVTPNADWVDLDLVVSTDRDQRALAPGELVQERVRGARRVLHYRTDRPVLNYWAVLSARYARRADHWNGVALEVWYHPAHDFDVRRMLDAMKKTLAYCSRAFAPYQFRTLRIVEFPRYESFAQSFPNIIPFSESIGFILRPDDDNGIDTPFYVTAHEVAHQWWAHQVVGADAQGATVLSESLAQYSALMVMEHELGQSHMRRFLSWELDQYLSGRATETKKELPLLRVEDQGYIHYNKGALVLYALRDALGEEVLGGAIAGFLRDFRFRGPPYPTSADLLVHLRAVTPPDLQYLLTDLFETITLYENRALDATFRRTPDGRYEVRIRVEARKVRVDEHGVETPVRVHDAIDVGVLVGEGPDERALAIAKHVLSDGPQEIVVTTAELPERAGIDPWHRLIDRHPDDNVVAVREASSR